MSKIVNYFSLLCIGLMLATCRQADDWSMSGKTGFLVSLADEESVAGSRATPQELGEPAVTAFNLKIVRSATGEEVYNGGYTSDVIAASAGLYELTASFGDNPVLALDDPYYEGKVEGVEVKDGETASVTIPCRVANALLSVKFENTDKIAEIYSDYHITVEVAGEKVEMEDISKSAYFRAGSSVKIYFVGTLKNGGEEKSVELVDEAIPASLVAGEHLILTLKASPELLVNISEVEIKDVTVTETIPVSWLPKPKTEAEGFDESNTLAFAETEVKTARLNLNLSSPLQDIKFKFDFQDEQFDGALETGKEYLLSEPADRATVEAALGITLPEPGTEEASLDLSALVAKLHTNAGVPTTNRITVVPKANDRWSSEKMDADSVYTLVCNRPEFSVSAYPGNIWTKEFTMNALLEEQVTAGNFEKLSQNMKYQFSVDGSTEWIDLGEDLRKDGLQPGTVYYIRGVYRNEIYSDVVEVATYPEIELENGDMEDWTEEERGYYYAFLGVNAAKLRTYYPWKNTPYWNTNNDFTTRHRDASSPSFSIVYRYNSFPAVSYTKDVNDGAWAAELRNTAAGRGNTSSSNSSYDFNNVPGELFLGDISVTTGGTDAIPSGDHYDIIKGRPFGSRPTALRFYYKYAPYNSDLWKVYIALYDSQDNIIAENTMTKGDVQNTYTSIDIPFNYIDDLNAVPKKIYVYFASSVYSGDQLPYHKMDVATWYQDSQRTDETLSGSVLTIDDISLVYDK